MLKICDCPTSNPKAKHFKLGSVVQILLAITLSPHNKLKQAFDISPTAKNL